MFEQIFKSILTSKVYDLAIRSPLEYAGRLTQRTGKNVYLKREDLQPVFSFKLRGAYNRMAHLSPEEKRNGVIAASAGNHAQGVAMSARHMGIHSLIVMPATTPVIKIQAVRALGSEIILYGDSYQEAAVHAQNKSLEMDKVFIHPFDDPLVIAGQGTIGFDILQQLSDVDAVYIPVGGGGLLSGIALCIKELKPEIKIIGVQPEDSCAMKMSLAKGERISLDYVGIFADGVAVKRVGELTFAISQKYVDDIVTVTTDEICTGIKAAYEDTRMVLEPAGALAVAGILKKRTSHFKNIVAVNSGANMNFDRLQFVSERTRVGEGSEALFAVTIPERPGALRELTGQFLSGKNITEFNYRMNPGEPAQIFFGFSIESYSDRDEMRRRLFEYGYACSDLTDNELAKVHIRHMVGGRSRLVENEVLYRFQFPERKGALSHFLSSMSETWNISLFHYRMHGGDFGRVLVGLQIPSLEKDKFSQFLGDMNFYYFEETENPAYRLFL